MLKELHGAQPATGEQSRARLWMAIAALAAMLAAIAVFALRPGTSFEEAGAEADSAIVEIEERGYPGP